MQWHTGSAKEEKQLMRTKSFRTPLETVLEQSLEKTLPNGVVENNRDLDVEQLRGAGCSMIQAKWQSG